MVWRGQASQRERASLSALRSLPLASSPAPAPRTPLPARPRARPQLAKFAEDDRIEQMNAQRRRMKQLEHRKEIERLLGERRAAFERERDTAVQEFEADAARELERISIVEEERQRILRAHAAVLGLHDLPKGVLKNEQDAALFSQYGASPGERERARGGWRRPFARPFASVLCRQDATVRAICTA